MRVSCLIAVFSHSCNKHRHALLFLCFCYNDKGIAKKSSTQTKKTATKKTAPKKKATTAKTKKPSPSTKKAATKKKSTPKKKTATKKKTTKKKISLVRLGSPEKAYDMDVDMNADMIEGAEHPNHTATKITCGVLGIATTAALGLYLYKKRRTKTKNKEEQEHSKSAPDPMDIV